MWLTNDELVISLGRETQKFDIGFRKMLNRTSPSFLVRVLELCAVNRVWDNSALLSLVAQRNWRGVWCYGPQYSSLTHRPDLCHLLYAFCINSPLIVHAWGKDCRGTPRYCYRANKSLKLSLLHIPHILNIFCLQSIILADTFFIILG